MAKKIKKREPWKFLEAYRGKSFTGEWPTLVELFEINASIYGDKNFLKAYAPKEESFSYTEALKKVKEISYYLLSQGVKKGDKIAVSGKNSPEWALAYLGILFAGGIVVPLDASYNNTDMETLMAFGDVTRLFIDADRVDTIDSEGKVGLKEVISLEPSKTHKFVLDLDGPVAEAERATEHDLLAIMFTSGTTGVPKGVMLTHQNIVSDCYLAQVNMDIYSDDVFYAILPLHHSYTMLAVFIETISCGASVVFGKKLVVSQILKELKLGKVTMFLAVPMLFNKMIAALMDGVKKKGIIVYGLIRFLMSISGAIKKLTGKNVGKKMFGFLLKQLSLDTNRICICGGGPLPASTFKMFNQLGIDFVQGYGLTETSPITHLNPVEAYNEASVGRACGQVQTKIVDPDSDGNGLIYIKGPMVMQGYYKNQEATDEVLHDGWLNTGDVGHIDADDYLYLTGRAKNIIVTEGGKNVFPEEIEDHFQLYGDIDTICILGYTLDAKQKTEGIRALVYPSKPIMDEYKDDKAGLDKHINGIISEVNKELQSYKKIQLVTVVLEPLAMTSTKKIKRFEVAKKYKLD